MSASTKHTVAGYFAVEYSSEERFEFVNGEIIGLGGATIRKGDIKSNLVGEVFAQLKGGPCRTYSTSQRVKIERTGVYTYPDVLIVCGHCDDDLVEPNTLVNPHVVFEIRSGERNAVEPASRFFHYRQLPSVQEYVLVCWSDRWVQHYIRQPDNKWLLTFIDDPDDSLTLAMAPVTIPLADIYRNVEITEEPLP
jgi:Uma2 family endonuclease